jgi:hypothetical protein
MLLGLYVGGVGVSRSTTTSIHATVVTNQQVHPMIGPIISIRTGQILVLQERQRLSWRSNVDDTITTLSQHETLVKTVKKGRIGRTNGGNDCRVLSTCQVSAVPF